MPRTLGNSFIHMKEIDYFVYLGYKSSGGSIVIGFSRICHAIAYGDFSTTSTDDDYFAASDTMASTDQVEVIGRFNAISSGSASYNWSIPATSIIISRPIFETRKLSWTPSYSAQSPMTYTSVSTNQADYQVHGREITFVLNASGTTGGSAGTTLIASFPWYNYGYYTMFASSASEGGLYYGGISFGYLAQIFVSYADLHAFGLGSSRGMAASGTIFLE